MLSRTATGQSGTAIRDPRLGNARSAILIAALVLFAGVSGCGANFSDLLFQSATAAGNTAFDLLLTDFANQIADSFNPPADNEDVDGAGDTGGDGDGGDVVGGNGGDGGDGDGSGGDALPAGDPVAGEMVFRDTGCNACHGDNAEGVVGPALAGMNKLSALQARFGGGATHMGKTLSDQDIENVAAWLLSL